ncbi:hypothetical protein SDC9_86974 [bioreactor metagenome]|uniref:Uncharacterized protein n=1 Tax=bioreactor metagenome TaxID=1076179 RepID=A0A644ZRV2_9ZZZZ
MRDNQRRFLHALNHLRHGVGFTAAGNAEQNLRRIPAQNALREAVDCLRLVAGGFIFGYHFKFVHCFPYLVRCAGENPCDYDIS